MVVSVASVLLPIPVLSSYKIVDWILRGIDIENSLHYLDCLFALEVAAIGMIDGVVLDLSSGTVGSLEQTEKMPLVLGMLVVNEEAPARIDLELQASARLLNRLPMDQLPIALGSYSARICKHLDLPCDTIVAREACFNL